MFFTEIIFIFLIALLLTAVIGSSYRERDGGGILLFFTIVFMGTLALGLWVTPVGPIFLGVYWLNLLLIGIFIALILASIPHSSNLNYGSEEHNLDAEQKANKEASYLAWYGFNVFFWILIGFLILVIISASFF